ncbi:MAG: glycosyl transferase [Anaerolineae bacterium]
MFYFCTYFDSNYFIKGLALYRSLVRHATPFHLWVLCCDDWTYEILQELALPEVHPISLRDFEDGDKELLRAKGNRSQIEYYFTCTPSLLLYILRNHSEVDVITYLDADLFFFSSPSPIYEELGDNSILIIGHRFPPHLRHREVYGIYNVGFLSFRRNDEGLRCLHWWRDRCLEWCYDRVENGRFADQKYLDDWPIRFPRVVVLQHKGAGLAPWNVAGYSIRECNGSVLVDSDPLVFYHFHNLKMITRFLFDPDLGNYGAQFNDTLRRRIYGPYLRELRSLMRQKASVGNPRGSRSCSHGDLVRLVLYGRTLLVIGPITAEVHLESTARPLLHLRRLALRRFRCETD